MKRLNRTLKKITALAAGLMAALSCVEEPSAIDNPLTRGGEGFLTFSFGPSGSVQVETRSSVPHKYEVQVHNFYLFVFDSHGAKITSHYFDEENLRTSEAIVKQNFDNCWYVSNATSNSSSDGDAYTTSGIVRVKIQVPSDGKLSVYMLANLDADMTKISSDLLASTVSDENDLLNFAVYMNQTLVTRNGYFSMYGALKNLTLEASTSTGSTTTVYTIKNGSSQAVVPLKHIDSKVRFVFRRSTVADAKGQTVTSFEPVSWQVMNVPRTTYAFGYAERGVTEDSGHDIVSVDPSAPLSSYSTYASNFFDTEPVTFEEYPSADESAFTFYMTENRQTPKRSADEYRKRSLRVKVPEAGTTNILNQETTVNYVVNGKSYERTMRCFEYANDFSTYVVVKGRVTMSLVDDSAGQTLGADVVYVIHLGDWSAGSSGGYDDYNVVRNHSYTYTVTVNSVNNIRVEVESSNDGSAEVIENDPGASGDVTVAKEEIALCDAHYVSQTLNFHLKNFFERGNISQEYDVSGDLYWSVKTPFCEGEPRVEGGIDITDGLDYKWVHFRLNKKDDDGKYFQNMRRKYVDRSFASSTVWRTAAENAEGDGTAGLAGYHNDGIMDVSYLVKYMKEQVRKYLEDPETSDFDSSTEAEGGPKISLTVFVDEYYYDKHPLTGETSPTLWKQFVNTDDRKLHILCNSNLSKDLESRATGSVITIQQHSIQCIFNTDESNTDLLTAWGVENEDEYEKGLQGYDSSTKKYTTSPYWSATYIENRGNSDQFNGLINTAKEWGLCAKSGTSFQTGSSWGTYLKIEVDNSTPQLEDAYRYLRYSCMVRNRDNNGDGKIDRSELRWYMASVQQLIGLFVGKNLLNPSTQLYNRSAADRASSDVKVWQQHVVSSTYGVAANYATITSNNPLIVWAEEGISTGGLRNDNVVYDYATVRCVRNLGNLGGVSDETYSLSLRPDDYITVSTKADGGKIYNSTNLNSKAHRYYSTKELPLHNETDIENQLYKSFETDPNYYTLSSSMDFKTFNEKVDDAIATGTIVCPDGWRVPSQVELAAMYYYGGDTSSSNSTFSRTTFSLGYYGTKKESGKYGFMMEKNININLSNKSINTFRCVRDIRID